MMYVGVEPWSSLISTEDSPRAKAASMAALHEASCERQRRSSVRHCHSINEFPKAEETPVAVELESDKDAMALEFALEFEYDEYAKPDTLFFGLLEATPIVFI